MQKKNPMVTHMPSGSLTFYFVIFIFGHTNSTNASGYCSSRKLSTAFSAGTPSFRSTYRIMAKADNARSQTISATHTQVMIFPAMGGIFSIRRLRGG